MSFMLKYFYITYSTNNMYYNNTERFNRIKMVDIDKNYYLYITKSNVVSNDCLLNLPLSLS